MITELKSRLKAFLGTAISAQYWQARYASGGDSGNGSKGELALFKARVINDFIESYKPSGVIDFGCGNGDMTAMLDLLNITNNILRIRRIDNNPSLRSVK